MNSTQKTRRLFFALWPDEHIRHSIVETFARISPPVKGRVIQTHNLHLSLFFIGPVTQDVQHCMHDAALTVSSQSFDLALDCFGHFRRAKIFWLGCQQSPDGLIQLHNKLGMALANCGYQHESRAFTPHMTLLRKCSKADAPALAFSIPWRVEEFVLVESITYQEGVKYRVIEKYPLSC